MTNRFAYLTALLALLTVLALVPKSLAVTKNVTKVAIIDTGLDFNDPRFRPLLCKSGSEDLTGEGITDIIGHGTHVAGLIKQYATPNAHYCFLVFKYYSAHTFPSKNTYRMTEAILDAIRAGADIINVSGGGYSPSQLEYTALALHPHTLLVAAAGNDNTTRAYFPAAYHLPNVVSVGSKEQSGDKSTFSNYGSWVHAWEYGDDVMSTLPGGTGVSSGTSMATAIHTGKIVAERATK